MSEPGKLESRLGYSFQQQELLEQALTHRSFSSLNYERLEFLGDAVLNFSIAAALYERFAETTEGVLSRLRARLVKQEALAEVAREIDLGTHLVMGSGELKRAGFERDSTLADALEAVLGAIYLDGGMDAVSTSVATLFSERLERLSVADAGKDAKTRLQEYLQAEGESVPEYKLVKTRGKPPNEVFEVECHSSRFNQAIRSTGSSRKKAEQSAAAAALLELGVSF